MVHNSKTADLPMVYLAWLILIRQLHNYGSSRSRGRGGGRQVATKNSEQMGKNVGIIKMIFLTKCLHNIH